VPDLINSLDQVIERINAFNASANKRIIIGIVGKPGAGKSTLTEHILNNLPKGVSYDYDTLTSNPEKSIEKSIVLKSTHSVTQSTVVALSQKKSTVVLSTFALVVIDHEGPASYPDNPNILVTNNWLDCCK
jgi:ABC-type glutathione transport system ATPase component